MIIKRNKWSIDTSDWLILDEQDGITSLVPISSDAALQFSHFSKDDGEISPEEIQEMAEEHNAEDSPLRPIEMGDYSGYEARCEDHSEGLFWRKFWLFASSSHLFITFNCPLGEHAEHEASVNRILNTLRNTEK